MNHHPDAIGVARFARIEITSKDDVMMKIVHTNLHLIRIMSHADVNETVNILSCVMVRRCKIKEEKKTKGHKAKVCSHR